MKNWLIGLLSAAGTALVGLLGMWLLGVFQTGVEAIEDKNIEEVVKAVSLDEDDIRRILDDKLTTDNGETYGQVLVSTREQVIVLRTKVEVLERALDELTR